MKETKPKQPHLIVDKEVHSRFKIFAIDSDIPLQKLTERALVEFMQNNRNLVKKKLK